MKLLSVRTVFFVLVIGLAFVTGYRAWLGYSLERKGLSEVANGDAQFWLMQGPPNDRVTPCAVIYRFDIALNEQLLKDRVAELAYAFSMFQRNIVEVDGLPYWQSAGTDWERIYRVLDSGEDLAQAVIQAELDVSEASSIGEGLPLFRVIVSSDKRQLAFVWHHVVSDFEGMFNKHAKYLFHEQGERTKFGYQLRNRIESKPDATGSNASILGALKPSNRQLGFVSNGYVVTRIVLPVGDTELYELGRQSGLPMSDIFSLISLRAATLYEENNSQVPAKILAAPEVVPMISPISLRSSSMDLDEGNNRAVKTFPFVFPAESINEMHERILALEPASSSYETAGAAMKFAKRFAALEHRFRKFVMPDYVSNYFPLADQPLSMGEAVVVSHELRVPMVPYERTKFAWSNYNGQVELFLHTDPDLIATERMIASVQHSVSEVVGYLQGQSP